MRGYRAIKYTLFTFCYCFWVSQTPVHTCPQDGISWKLLMKCRRSSNLSYLFILPEPGQHFKTVKLSFRQNGVLINQCDLILIYAN